MAYLVRTVTARRAVLQGVFSSNFASKLSWDGGSCGAVELAMAEKVMGLHILIRHNEMNGRRQAILDTVVAPTMIRQGRTANERHFFRRRVGPSMWLHVVVHYDEGSGRITTAFGRRLLP